MDGAYEQTHCVMNYLAARNIQFHQNLFFTKTAAQCSMTQAANDVSKSHFVLKSHYRGHEYRIIKFKDLIEIPGEKWQAMKRLLQSYLGDDSPSFRTYWKALMFAPPFLSSAFTEKNCLTAYEVAGICPLNKLTIMNRNPAFRNFSGEEATFLLEECVPAVADDIEKFGYCSEVTNEFLLNTVFSIDNCPLKEGVQLNDMTTNRFRCMIMNAEFYMDLYHSKREHELMAAEDTRYFGLADQDAVDARKARATKCVNIDVCGRRKNNLVPKSNRLWVKCPGANCRAWCCDASDANTDNCFQVLGDHTATCNRVVRR